MVVMFSVAVLPTGKKESQSHFNRGRRAAQFYPIAIVVSLLNALDQIHAKKKHIMPLEKRIAFSK